MIGISPGQNYMGNSRSIDGEPSGDPENDALRAIALFFVVVSLVLAALVAASRHVWPEPSTAAIWLAPLYCAAVIFCWLCATIRQRRRSGTYALPVLLTLGVIALPCGVGTSGILAWMVGVLLALICVAGLAEALRGWRRYSAAQAIFLFVGAPAFAVILFLWVNTLGYANVLEPELAVFGHLKRDTLFHTAVSAMLSRHGVASTGLDGLVPLRYHVLSHLWIGRVAEWLQTTRSTATIWSSSSSHCRYCSSASSSRQPFIRTLAISVPHAFQMLSFSRFSCC